MINKNILIHIQYEGTRYEGWQTQPRGLTIQGLLQDCIYRLTGQKVKVIGAGRTDAGVHAIEQIATFETTSVHPLNVIKRALNAMLPDDVRIMKIEEVEEGFHARYSAIRKRYIYIIANYLDLPAFLRRYVWWVKTPLNLDAMKEAATSLIGTHDFSSFRGSGCGAKNSVRTVYSISLEKMDRIPFIFTEFKGNFIIFSIEARAFLRHMVRNIVGTIVEVGKGRLKPEMIKAILDAKDRRIAGPTAPPQGLFLAEVLYR